MKILHLIDSGGLYGAEAVLLNLVEQQRARGDEPLILSAGTPDCGEKPLEQAARELIHDKLPELGGDGGVIAIDGQGRIAMDFNTSGMFRGARDSNGLRVIGIGR